LIRPLRPATLFELVALLGLVACAGEPARRAPRGLVLVDDAGDTVRLAGPARRLVSLNPLVTELAFAMGAGARLAGRTAQCDYPPAAREVPSVGGWIPPNVETVAARSPDLVVAYLSPSSSSAVARLRALGIPTLALRTDRLADVSRIARLLGPALGAASAAESLAGAYDAMLAAERAERPREPALGVVLVAWDNPLIVLGAGSFVSEIAELAGARNLFADLPQSSAPASLETVASRAPDALLVVGGPDGFVARPEWRTLAAVRARVLRLDDPALTRPGLRVPGAIPLLRARFDSALRLRPTLETLR
jgi:iron complex transport system substrate-binding protein